MDTIRTLYRQILRRNPDPEGYKTYVKLLADTSEEHVARVLKESDECRALHADVYVSYDNVPLPGDLNKEKCHMAASDVKLVVSRYDEDVSWVPDDALIYNKGDPHTMKKPFVQLLNVGREGETYTQHIIKNYENIDEYTVFTQGDPFAHNPDFMDDIAPTLMFKPLSAWWDETVPPPEVRKACPTPHIHIGNHDFVCVYPVRWTDEGFMGILKRIKMRNNVRVPLLWWVCERLGLVRPEHGIPVSMCGMFGVHASRVYWYPEAFYARLRLFLLEHPDHGYVVERLWASLFLTRYALE